MISLVCGIENKKVTKPKMNYQAQITEWRSPEGWGEGEWGKEGQIQGDRRRLDFGWGTLEEYTDSKL